MILLLDGGLTAVGLVPGRKPSELARAVAQEIAKISQPALNAIAPPGA